MAHVSYRDTRQTLAAMQEKFRESFAEPAVFALGRSVVETVCAGISPKDYISEYTAVLNWVDTHIRYFRDPEPVELVKGPDVLLGRIMRTSQAQEDCESIALLIGFLCACAGGRVRFLTVGFMNGPRPARWPQAASWPPHTHAFVQVLDPGSGSWLTLDPVAGPRVRWMLDAATVARIYSVN